MAGKRRVRKEVLTHKELSEDRPLKSQDSIEVVSECYCPQGHSLISDLGKFDGFEGITLTLRNDSQRGQLALSPIIGDLSRTFFDFERKEGDIIDICCPTCDDPLPLYDQCSCGAYLVALFTAPKQDFANAIGICQRIGCLHSKIISNYNLRKYSRMGYY